MSNLKVTHFFLLNDESRKPFSGAENHLWELLMGLSKVCKVELLVFVGEVGPVIRKRFTELEEAGVQLSVKDRLALSKSKFKYIRILKEAVAYYKEFKCRKDHLLHLHLNTNILPLAAILAGHQNIFYTFHNDEPYFANWNSRLLIKYFVKKFRHVIAITNHVKNYLIKNVGLPEEKISVVYYGIDPPPVRNVNELKLPAFTGLINLGFVGRLSEQKNLFFFFDCIKELSQVSLVLFGEGPQKETLSVYASKLGMADRIYFHGYLEQASSYIKAFDFLCLPSKWEGLGLVLIEAMYQNVPVIGSDAGAIPEILHYGKFGTIISCADREESVKIMKQLFTDRMGAKEMAGKAYKYAMSNYTIKKMIDSTIKIYENTLK